LYHTFYFGGQLAVVKQGAVHTYLSQLQLIPGPVVRNSLRCGHCHWTWDQRDVGSGPLVHLLIRAAADCFEERASISQFRMILISKKELGATSSKLQA
jgi:hypothetical protein